MDSTLVNGKEEELTAEYRRQLAFVFSKPKSEPQPGALDSQFEQRVEALQRWLLKFAETGSNKAPLIFHVAGTKGKGSTSLLLSTCLQEMSFKTGLYTSPHLHCARERIKVNGNMIPVADFCKISALLNSSEAELPSFLNFFDRWTFIALAYFSQQNVDCIVLETGLGGRYDTTNCVRNVRACLLTSISFDHQDILGDTLEKIAWQKAGIIKSGAIAITNDSQPASVRAVFAAEALAKSCQEYFEVSAPDELKDVLTKANNPQFDISKAKFQADNASLVWHCLLRCFPDMDPLRLRSIFAQAVPRVRWPCRFETFQLPQFNNAIVILDGAHNEDSMFKLYGSVASLAETEAAQVWSLFGSGESRNWKEMVQIATAASSSTYLVKSQHFRAMSPQQLVEAAPSNETVQVCSDVPSTLSKVLQLVKTTQSRVVLVVCGSLFVSSEARVALQDEGYISLPPNDSIHYRDDAMPSGYK